jgi:hypothetical protein
MQRQQRHKHQFQQHLPVIDGSHNFLVKNYSKTAGNLNDAESQKSHIKQVICQTFATHNKRDVTGHSAS